MNRAALVLLSIGTALFVALLAWHGVGSVMATLAVAGWGLLAVTLFHLLPLALDAAAIAVLLERPHRAGTARHVLLARWAGESVNSLLPAGQIGGPVLMARHLAQRGLPMPEAAAAITVATTMQALSQITFGLIGVGLFAFHAQSGALSALRVPLLACALLLTGIVVAFWWAQRRGMFGHGMRLLSKLFGVGRSSDLATQADAIDAAVRRLYGRRGKLVASFALNLVAWLVGTGEVWLALEFLGHPVDWFDAMLLESVGQAIRGAAFAIPGSLGVQEGGYLLLAPLVGLPPETALALSLAKRARELALGLPGIVYLHFTERRWLRRRPVGVRVAD